MGFYNSCSPYDCQRRNGQSFDFARIKKHYEDVKPLRGKRKAENIRPIWQRSRYWERMIKVSDTEYYITFDWYRYRNNHNKAITFSLNNGMEFMTIHTPKKVWADNELYPETFRSASVFWFYNFNMPNGFKMLNYRTNKYVGYNDKFYTIEKGDIIFQRKEGSAEWQPLVVHREFKHTLDRKQTKELRKLTESFLPYYDIMCDMVQSDHIYGNAIKSVISGCDKESALALFKPKGDGSVPDEWLKMVEHYKYRIRQYTWDWQAKAGTETFRRDKLHAIVSKDLYAIVKPCHYNEVPLGEMTNDAYKGWFK